MDSDNKFIKFMREQIRKLNLELDEDDRKTGRLAARQAAFEKATIEKEAMIVNKIYVERHEAEKAAEAIIKKPSKRAKIKANCKRLY